MKPGKVFCVQNTSTQIFPHNMAIEIDENHVVISSYIKGWLVTSKDSVEKMSFFDASNLKSFITKNDKVVGCEVFVFDEGKRVTLTLARLKGKWVLKNDFEPPSWSKSFKKSKKV